MTTGPPRPADQDVFWAENSGALPALGAFHVEQHIADAMGGAHWHSHVEVNVLAEGHMTYLFNGRKEHVDAGRLVLFWAAIPHQTIEVTQNAPLTCIYLPLVDFLGLPIDRLTRQSVMSGDFLASQPADPTDVMAADRWVQGWRQGDMVRRRLIADEIRLRVRRLVLDRRDASHAALSSNPSASAAGRGPIARASTLAELINAHYASPLTLAHLARLANMAPATASRAFQDVFGLTVNEYIIRCRLAQAMQRLAETEEPVLQIAYGCGFGSSSQFYEQFKLRVKMTPRTFRSMVGRQ